jgi:hypothetical protein
VFGMRELGGENIPAKRVMVILGTVRKGGLRGLGDGLTEQFADSSCDSARRGCWRGAGSAAKGTEAYAAFAGIASRARQVDGLA